MSEQCYKQREWLYEQYWGLQKSMADIAETAGVATATIRRHLDKHDIETRSLSEANAKGDISKLLDKAWLRREYVEKERSSIEIADELNLSNDAVIKWLKKHGIGTRSRSEARSHGDVTKLHDKGWLREQYVKQGRSGPEIADACGVGTDTVYNWLEKHGVKVREQGITRSGGATKKLRDKDWLKQKYLDEQLSITEIAEECGCSRSSVRHWMGKYNIEARPGGRGMSDGDLHRLNNPIYLMQAHHEEYKSTVQIAEELGVAVQSVIDKLDIFDIERRQYKSDTADYEKLQDNEYLRTRYVDENWSVNEVAEDCNCSCWTVRNRLHELDIEIKRHDPEYVPSGLESVKQITDGNIEQLYDEKFVIEKYVEEELSMLEIADDLDVSTGAVINALRRYNIEARGYEEAAKTGSDHHNHKEVDTGYYGPNWDAEKLAARIRDHCKCQVCGINDKEHLKKYGRVNSVHHIMPRSYYVNENGELDHERANALSNLITLCSEHHPDYEGVLIDNREQ